LKKSLQLNIYDETNVDYLKELAKVLHSSNLFLQEKIKRLELQSFNHEQASFDLNERLSTLKKRFIFKGSEKLNPTRPSKDSSDVAMFYYTIVETCKKLKINPRRYLKDSFMSENLITPFEYKSN
jgi:hypothetical protein